MEPERWQQIERLYHDARAREKSDRPAFLAKACAGNEDLRQEVETLLTKADQAGSFLEAPAIQVAAESLAAEYILTDESTSALEPGAMVSHYRVTAKLGAGGMGEVYRARDTKLGRDVALKILPQAMAHDAQRMARFEREARTLASLNHPSIAAIHDLEESNGVHALVMELVEGDTLAERIVGAGLVPAHGPPRGSPLQESLAIARQIAEALECAHEHGIIHRDLKPANVKITPEGTVKLLDFGLAKAVARGFGPGRSDADLKAVATDSSTLSTTATRAGTILGTAAYMSPEQARGQLVDRRTDIWAFGCVLFEMLAGRRAFEGESISEVLAAVLMKEPDWNALPASTPVAIQKLVHHCLVKDSKRRLRDIGDARLAIEETLAGEMTAYLPGPVPAGAPLAGGAEVSGRRRVSALAGRRERGRWLAAVAVVTIAAFGAIVVLNVGGLRDRLMTAVGAGHGAPFPKIESVAVLPLENLSGDPAQEYFADGMTEELITDLGKISALRVISRQSIMRYKGSRKPLPEIARELHVDAIVEGTVRRSGDRVRVTANLLYAPSDRHMWAQAYESSRRDVLSLQDEVARAIANQIKVKLTPQEQTQFARAPHLDPDAHEAYLMGRYQWNKRTEESLTRSAEYFQQAIEKDPGYAPAYAGLADYYAILGDNGFRRPKDVFPKARAAAMRALELDPMLAEAHTSLGSVMKAYDWDWPGAGRELRRAIELNPNYSTAHQFYGELQVCLGRFPEAIAELKRARQLDPFAPRIHGILAWILYLAHRYDEGLEAVQNGIEVDPYHAVFFSDRGEIYLQKGMYERALSDFRKAEDLLPGPYYPHLSLLRVYALSGRKREALKALDELNEVSKRLYVMPSLVAVVYTELGDKQKAFAWLEKAYEQRDPWLGLTLRSEPGFDSLRSDPRYRDLVRRMNFPR